MSFLSKVFGARNKISITDYSSVAVDMHSHLIPGIDDGSKTLEESLALIRKFSDYGYKKLITTPHIIEGGFDNGPHNILPWLKDLQAAITEAEIPITIEASGEYYLDDIFYDKLGKEQLMSFGNNYILFELPFAFKPHFITSAVFKLNSAGYKPILAHPERYTYLHAKTLEHFEEIKNSGLYFQVNIGSIIGAYGPSVAQQAAMLIDAQMVEFIGSDLHGEKHFRYLEAGKTNEGVYKLVQSGKLMNATLL